MQGIILEIRYFEREFIKSFKKVNFIFLSNPMSSVCHSHVIRISLVCTRMSSVCHSYVLVCHPYVTCMYSHVIRISLVCTHMSSVCHSYVLICHPYLTRMCSYVIRLSLVFGFSMNPCKMSFSRNSLKFNSREKFETNFLVIVNCCTPKI